MLVWCNMATKKSKKTKKRKGATKKKAYIHKLAAVIGNVRLGKGCSIWPGAVVRGDVNTITLGDMVNVQDNCTLHADRQPIEIGDYTLIGHNAMLHGCKVGRGCLIGIGSIVLDGAEIGDGATITAGCMIRGGKKIPPGALVVQKGNELKVIEGKGNPIYAIAGCLEYAELAKRIQKKKFGQFSEKEEKKLFADAEEVARELGLLSS